MNNNFLVFSHEQELDGLFSATVLRMIYPQSEVILTNYGCENMVAMKNNILYKIIAELEQGRIDPELLKITIRLAKSPSDYAVNNPNKKIGMLLGAKAGDLIWYFRTEKDVSINPQEISIPKCKEIKSSTE